MTTAGVATVAFIAIIAAVYLPWTWTTWRVIYRPRLLDSSFRHSAAVFWLVAHGLLVIIGAVMGMGWLGSVAGWWS